MAGIDTSIYSNQQRSDPFSAVGSAVNMANAFTQNQALNLELQNARLGLAAKQAVGNAFQGAYNQNTGTVDADAAGSAIAADPNAAYGAPEAFHSAAALKGQNTANTSALTGLNQSQNNYLSSQIFPLFNDPKNPPSLSDVSGVISAGIHSGAIDPKAGNAMVADMLKNGGSPQKLKAWAQNRFVGSMGAAQGSPSLSVATPAGTKTLSAGQSATGAQNGDQPSAGVTTNPGIGVTDTYKAANDQKISDYNASSGILGNARNLEIANDKLATLDPSDAGAVGDAKNSVLNMMVALHMAPSTAPMSREEAEKYLEKSKASLPAAQRSDMAQHLADVSNPNLHTSLEATKALTKSALGFARMDAAVPFAWDVEHPNQPKGQTDPDYLKYRAKFMNSQDPDGFIFNKLQPAEQRAMISAKQKAGPDAFGKFRSSLQTYDQTLAAGANP